MQKNNVVFIIRSYNESSRILRVIESIFGAGFEHIVVVDDGSLDGTEALLEEHFGDQIFSIRHVVNRGGGAALETGFEFVRRYASKYGWKYVVTFDADGQMDIDDMVKFMDVFDQDDRLDVAIGSRVLEGSQIHNMPWYRKIIVLFGGRIFTWIISGRTPSDPHNGYRMFTQEAVEKIRLTMDGFEYASELIDEIVQQGLRWKDVPVTIHYDEYTLGKGQKASNALNIAFRMIFKKFF